MCNSILKSLCKSVSNLVSFSEMYPTIAKMKVLATAHTENSEQFKKIDKSEPKSSSGLRYHIYLRGAQEVLKGQLSFTNNHKLILSVREGPERCHVMSPAIGFRDCRIAVRLVKSSGDSEVSRKSAAFDKMDSAIGYLQVFSDKSPTSLSADSLQFYTFM